MKKSAYIILPLLSFLFCFHLQGQETKKTIDKCNCQVAFDDLTTKLENNYIGLKQLQMSGELKGYDNRRIKYRLKSAKIPHESCTAFLDDFLDYFDDGHLHVLERPRFTASELNEIRKNIKDVKLELDHLKKQALLAEKTASIEPLETLAGSWTDGVSTFVILEANNVFKAYILETTKEEVSPGELKAIFTPNDNRFSCRYYSYNYSPMYIRGNVYKDGQLLVAGHVFWKRVDPTYSIAKNNLDGLEKPTVDILNPKTTLITIPSFNLDFKYFKAFVEKNELSIKNSRNLIIDIRGNRGGNGVYFPLIELYASRNMPGSQGFALSSKNNQAYFQHQMKYAKKIYKSVVKRMEENPGQIIDGPSYPVKKFKISDNLIENVAILTDHGSASAAESFILHSKRASNKVKTFGSATAGMIDYTSVNIVLLESGSQNIHLAYPTSTLHKEIPEKGYNVTGVIPDISIGNSIPDKIGFITNYYRQ